VNHFGYRELLFLLVGGVIIILPLWKIFPKPGIREPWLWEWRSRL